MGLIGEDEKFEHAYAYVALFSVHVFFLSINLTIYPHVLIRVEVWCSISGSAPKPS